MPSPPPLAVPDPSARIVIAGFGLLSPLGHSAWETFGALLAGRSIAERAAKLPPDIAPVDLVRAVGAVGVAQHGATDPTVELAERAAREACSMAGVAPEGLPAYIGTSKGAIAAMAGGGLRMAEMDKRKQRTIEAVTLGPCGYLSHHLQRRLGLASTQHYVAACASSLTALHFARQRLLHQPSPLALVLTAESALLPMFIHSYRRLGVLADATPAGYRQRPLDERRQGFMLSELGAAVLLKRLAPGEAPAPGQLELLDTGIATESNDLIRASPTMEGLGHLAGRLLAGRAIDMLHPHAPGTPDHDAAELDVLLRATPGSPPDLYAYKGALGHGLGAAGLTALVLACLCLTAGKRPPMPWLTEPIAPARDAADPRIARPCSRTGTHTVFSAGFGSHVAGAVVRRH